jgi:plastocyanin
MIRRLIGVASVVVVLAAFGAPIGIATASDPAVVDIVNFTYQPTPRVLNVGDTVSFRNLPPNATHSAVFDTPGPFTFNTGDINPGEVSAPIAVTTTGAFEYYCSIHGRSMTGVLLVQAAPVVAESRWPALLGISGTIAVLVVVAFMLRRQRRARV